MRSPNAIPERRTSRRLDDDLDYRRRVHRPAHLTGRTTMTVQHPQMQIMYAQARHRDFLTEANRLTQVAEAMRATQAVRTTTIADRLRHAVGTALVNAGARLQESQPTDCSPTVGTLTSAR